MDKKKRTKILIVEDERVLADVLESKLKREGYEVATTYDGEQGYSNIVSWKPDLILLDIVMPKMDGYEVMEKMDAEKNRTPVIIISNSGQPVEIEKTRKLGAVDHLIKTQFDPSEVVTKVKNYLNHGVTEKTSSPSAGDSKAMKILLVEDDRFLRNICQMKLTKVGYQVFESSDGEEVIQILEQHRPNVVLLDIILPSTDGFEILSQIRSHKNPDIAKTPVIMLSNLGQEQDIQRAHEMGANSFMIKANFTTSEIVKKIESLLGINK